MCACVRLMRIQLKLNNRKVALQLSLPILPRFLWQRSAIQMCLLHHRCVELSYSWSYRDFCLRGPIEEQQITKQKLKRPEIRNSVMNSKRQDLLGVSLIQADSH